MSEALSCHALAMFAQAELLLLHRFLFLCKSTSEQLILGALPVLRAKRMQYSSVCAVNSQSAATTPAQRLVPATCFSSAFWPSKIAASVR